nr:hypothetical protein [Candidatus Saccharibacteria bacterium]
VELEPGAAEFLAREGNDPLLGARPMRRIVQKTVENIIAERILQGQAQPGTVINLTVQEIQGHL